MSFRLVGTDILERWYEIETVPAQPQAAGVGLAEIGSVARLIDG